MCALQEAAAKESVGTTSDLEAQIAKYKAELKVKTEEKNHLAEKVRAPHNMDCPPTLWP